MSSWKEFVFCVNGDSSRLSNVWRYSSIPITVRENTAEHSFFVSLYALMIHREVCFLENVVRSEYEHAILVHAITHDLSEAVTGDVVRPFKYITPEFKEAVDKAEDMAVNKGTDEIKFLLNSSKKLIDRTPIEAKFGKSYIKDVVKAADFMSLYRYMMREVNRGNSEIHDFAWKMVDDLSSAHDTCTKSDAHAVKIHLSQLYHEMAESARTTLINLRTNA